jgi:Dual specificity phosphatase, catalytic domain
MRRRSSSPGRCPSVRHILSPGRGLHALYSAPVEIDQSHLLREPFQVAYALERGDESYVDVPVLTEVEPGLWFGGAPEPRPPEGFDFIVNLVAPWARYDPNGIACVNVAVEDGEVTAEVAKQFSDLAHEVNRRRDLGQTILVHCQVGLNRSATVVALVLMLRGMKAEDAIRLLREKRHRLVICNPHFERWLLDDELLSGELP